MTSFYTEQELRTLGLKSFGENVLISRKCSIYGADKISVGNHVRIDDFCILSGNIVFHDYIHLSAYAALFAGSALIEIDNYCAISSRTVIYAESDDYSGEGMTNPMVPDKYRNVQSAPVYIKKHAIIGSGCTVLPGITVEEGTSVGAMSLINRDTRAWTINAGIPCRYIRERARKPLEYEKLIQTKGNL